MHIPPFQIDAKFDSISSPSSSSVAAGRLWGLLLVGWLVACLLACLLGCLGINENVALGTVLHGSIGGP